MASGVVAAPKSITFASNLPAAITILTINGSLSTATLTVNERTAGNGAEIQIGSGGSLTVTGTMEFGGGNISGSGNLNINAPDSGSAALHIDGTVSGDKPTLGVPLTLNSVSTTGAATMDFDEDPVQPLVVTGNASITVNQGATLTFDGEPLDESDTATSISNGDAGDETIYVNSGGSVTATNDCTRTVGMGIDLGDDLGGAAILSTWTSDVYTLEFTGQDPNGYGMTTHGGGEVFAA